MSKKQISGVFLTEEFVLVDKGLRKSIRNWAAPIDATPFGISADGEKLYFEYEFGDNEYENGLHINELAIEISEDGTIQFIESNNSGIIKGKELKGYPRTGEISYRQFNVGNKSYIVKFSYPCT